MFRFVLASFAFSVCSSLAPAAPPVLSYVFPAGGQRGTAVPLRVGGLFLHDRSHFEIDRLSAGQELKSLPRIWFEGPIVPLPESQQAEDYPVDRSASVAIPKDAPRGPHRARLWTSQGAAAGPAFVVGELPEIVEAEIEGDPIPVPVKLPVTANGRIFPREDIDLWSFAAKKGESITAFATVSEIRSAVVPQLEIVDATGKVLAEQTERPGIGQDAAVRFTAPNDGTYSARIRDARNAGGPAYVYRLTITGGPVVDRVFPLGGRRGSKLSLAASGQALANSPVEIAIPADAPAPFSPSVSAANAFALDIDDLPEQYASTAGAIAVPAALNGRVEKPGTASEWRLNLKKGTKFEFELLARSLGSPLCGVLAISDASGKELARGESADPMADPKFAFSPPADGVYTVRITERFRNRGGPEFAYRLKVRDFASTSPGFRLSLASDIANVPRGSTVKLKVTAERFGGFVGSIELSARGLPPGITTAKAVIGEKQASAELALTAEAAAKILPARIAIVGTSAVASVSTDLFAVASVPAPFKFTGEYTMGNAPRGQPYSRKYRLERNGFDGPITVQLADRQVRHLQGASGVPVVVPPGKNDFEYSAQLPAWIETGRTCRVALMAVGKVKDGDGTEHSVSFTSAEQNHQMIVVPEPGRLGIECDSSSIQVKPGQAIELPFRVSRAKGLNGAAKVELILPAHWRGVSAKIVEIAADREFGKIAVQFGSADLGPFNGPATLRAALGDAVAETKLEFVPAR